MATSIYVYVFGGVVFLALGCLLVYFWLKWRLKRIDAKIKPEVLDSYNDAERRYKESGGRNQNEILWDIAAGHFGGTKPGYGRGIEQPEVRETAEQREDVHGRSAEQPDAPDKRNKRSGWTAI